jgi:hypothetical protein
MLIIVDKTVHIAASKKFISITTRKTTVYLQKIDNLSL